MFKDKLAHYINWVLHRPLGYLGYAPYFVRHDQACFILSSDNSVRCNIPDPEVESAAGAWLMAQMYLGFLNDPEMCREVYSRLEAEYAVDDESLIDDSKSSLTLPEPK